MTRIDLEIPEDLRAFAEAEAARSGHSNIGDYVTSLLREAERRAAKAELEAKLLHALDSPAREMTDHDWDALDQQFEARHTKDQLP